jgi:23S rRNA (guanosine2251-2'-O)-methyltransferase
MDEPAIMEGWISVEAALRSGNRRVDTVYISRNKSRRDVATIERMARATGAKVERVDPDAIDARATGKTHGGVVAIVGERRFLSLEDLLEGSNTPFIVMLDGVEDPFNFGSALRSLYAAGATGVVVRPRNWTSAAGTVAKASAGASELMPMAVADSAVEAADFLRGRGVTVACTAQQGAVAIYEADLSGPLFLLIGGEKRGVTRSFLDAADLLLTVPYARRFTASLGTGAATSIIAFEVMRQRASGAKPDPAPRRTPA